MKISVIIPVYKSSLENYEIISLKRVYEILGNKYDIILIGPEDLNINSYINISQNYTLKNLRFQNFSKNYFKSIQSYNKLMLDEEFYRQFLQYNYILIYQLDCYVFQDEFEYWCKQSYDYIGAPWLTYNVYNLSKFQKLRFFIKQFVSQRKGVEVSDKSIEYRVGNGGFSLRNPQKFHEVLVNTESKIIHKYMGNNSYELYNEDVFWSYEVNKRKTKIKIPPYKKAVGFSLELNPEIGLRMNKNKLPFGCHGWQKQINFWKKYISDYSNE